MNGGWLVDQKKPFIAIHGVSKVFPSPRGDVHALADVSLDIAAHEFISLIGPSGCGKSTLLMTISGLVRLTEGSVIIDGHDVQRPYTDLGFVFQQDLLMEWRSVLRNVTIQGEIRGLDQADSRRRALDLLAMLGLEGFEDKYPYELSGGMRQRVAIGRALLHDPPLLLMDEPFGALDAMTREEMNVELLHVWDEQHKTVVFVTHSIPEAIFLSDRVIVLSARPGRVIDDLTIAMPRPRPLDIKETPQFGKLVQHIRGLLYKETRGKNGP